MHTPVSLRRRKTLFTAAAGPALFLHYPFLQHSSSHLLKSRSNPRFRSSSLPTHFIVTRTTSTHTLQETPFYEGPSEFPSKSHAYHNAFSCVIVKSNTRPFDLTGWHTVRIPTFTTENRGEIKFKRSTHANEHFMSLFPWNDRHICGADDRKDEWWG